jgi:hypothetical protein
VYNCPSQRERHRSCREDHATDLRPHLPRGTTRPRTSARRSSQGDRHNSDLHPDAKRATRPDSRCSHHRCSEAFSGGGLQGRRGGDGERGLRRWGARFRSCAARRFINWISPEVYVVGIPCLNSSLVESLVFDISQGPCSNLLAYSCVSLQTFLHDSFIIVLILIVVYSLISPI